MLFFQDKSVLILIDLQLSYSDLFNYTSLEENIPKLIKTARKQNIPIIFILELDNQDSHWLPFWTHLNGERHLDQAYPLPFALPTKKDKVFIKNGYDAFFETGLDKYLKRKGYQNIYFAGVLTSVCVLNSIFTAFNLGYFIYLISDCCGDKQAKRHEKTLEHYQNYLYIPLKLN